MSIFNNSKLLISARSPFARRVRIAFKEHKISYEEVVMNVFEFNPLLNRHNPLRRVPTIVLQSGDEIVDSSSILKTFYEEQKGSALVPQTLADKVTANHWSGVAIGICEMIVSYFIETQRPAIQQDQAGMKETGEIIADALARYNSYLGTKTYCLGNQFTQTDIDWGTSLFYLQLRMPGKFEKAYPHLNDYMNRLAERESFKSTMPPA
jgi:glutathione S-transferase